MLQYLQVPISYRKSVQEKALCKCAFDTTKQLATWHLKHKAQSA